MPCDGYPKCVYCEGVACHERRETRSARMCASEMVILSAQGGSALFSNRPKKSMTAELGTVNPPTSLSVTVLWVEATPDDTEPL